MVVAGPLLAVLLGAAPYALDAPLPGPDSQATAWVRQTLLAWPPPSRAAKPPSDVIVACLTTPGRTSMVGVWQEAAIAAPLAQVAALVDDFGKYPELYPDLAKVQVVPGSVDANRFLVAWENIVPVFFIPNVKYETTYVVDRSAARVAYVYKLKAKGTVQATDGFVVLEALGPAQTRFTEVDFVDADFGPVGAAAAWTLTATGFYRSDVALKLKAEHPTWPHAQAKAEALRVQPAVPLEDCFRTRRERASLATGEPRGAPVPGR